MIVDSRDDQGRPLAVALTNTKDGEIKLTGVSTLFGMDNSAEELVRAIVEGDARYIAQKETARLEDLLSRPQLPLPAGNQPPTHQQSRTVNVTIASDGGEINLAIPADYRERLKGVKFSTRRVVGKSARQYTPEQQAFFDRTGRAVDEQSLKEKVQSLWKDAGKKLAQGIFDQFALIKDLSKDAYALARLSKGAPGAVEALLHHGKLSLTDNVYDADTSGGFIERVGLPLQGELESHFLASPIVSVRTSRQHIIWACC